MSDGTQQSDSLDWIKHNADESKERAAEPVAGDIVLEGSLGIAEAEAMHQTFSQILDAQVDISIQSEDLSRVDAAGVQLAYAFIKEAKARSVAVKWESVSDALLEAASALGLNDKMGFSATDSAVEA